MRLFLVVCKQFNLTGREVFRLTFDYFHLKINQKEFERIVSPHCIMHKFKETGKFKKAVTSVPKCVEDFCFDLLMGNIKLLKERD